MSSDDPKNPRQQQQQQQPQVQAPKVTAMQDLIAGGVAGSASVIVGHPFDTYKVRLQTSPSHSTPTNPAAFGGISSLFRGMAPPLSTAAVVNALIFSAYGESSRIWDVCFPQITQMTNNTTMSCENNMCSESSSSGNSNKSANSSGNSNSQQLEETKRVKAFVCGSIAGAVQALVICPTEHIKCRLQIQHGIGCKDNIYKGPYDALEKIVHSNGISGLYRGFICTAWREIPAFGLYFATYDYVRETVTTILRTSPAISDNDEDVVSSIEKNSSQEWAASALAGGFSGALTWAAIYPFDVIKTRIQTTPLNTPIERRRITYMFHTLWKEHGIKYFFRGLGVTLLRAFPVNAIIFPVYEFTLFELNQRGIGSFQTNRAMLETGV